MRSFHIDTDRLGPVMVRQAPTARLGENGAPQVDDNGQVVYLGRVIVPGVASSPFAPGEARQVRLKVTGELPAGVVDGATVRLAGRVLVTSWFLRGGRGRDARSEVTISPERVDLAAGEVPTFDGELPVRPPTEDPFTFMAWAPAERGGFDAALVVPSSVIDEAGTVRVTVDVQPDDALRGRPVLLDGLTARVVQPDSEDVGRMSKAGFVLHATRLVAADGVAVAGSRARRAEPTTDNNSTEGQ